VGNFAESFSSVVGHIDVDIDNLGCDVLLPMSNCDRQR
jgi:hypothetical protein